MLAPRASSAFVCIRCELQLARRRLPAYPRRRSHANFSTALRLQDGADELEALSQGPSPSLNIIKEKPQLDRIRKRKGKTVRETSARLGGGMKRLGDDAEILVLREVADNKLQEGSRVPEQSEPLPVPDIVGSLKREHEALTPEDIHHQLESLRPEIHANPDEPLHVPLKAFIKLIRDMNSGFSREQLSQFYSAAKNVQQEELRNEVIASLKGTGTDQRTTTRSNWQPGNTPIARRLPGVDMEKRNKRIPVSKHLLVDRIIRDLWKLVPMEEDEALGEIELSLKPWQVTMLNSGDDTLLSRISRVRKAKIEIYQQHSVLRITADRTTAEYVADDIEEALQNVETKKVQLKSWIPWLDKAKVPEDQKLATLYTEEDFHMVTSLTRASIQRMDNTNTLVIRGLDKDAVAEAERTLIRLLPFKDSTVHTIDTHEVDAAKNQVHLLPASYDAKSLELRQRNANLGRWSLPVGRKAQDQNPKAHDAESELLERESETLPTRNDRAAAIVRKLQQLANKGLAADQAAEGNSDEVVKEGPKFKLAADFGQALFPLVDTAPSGKSKSKLPSNSQPTFTSSIPGLTSLLVSAYTQSFTNVEQSPTFQSVSRVEDLSLLYDFVAAPEQERLEAGQTPPTLRIQMRTNRLGGEAIFRKLGLCFQEHVHSVLLPGDAVDVKFTRYGRIHIHDRKSPKLKVAQQWVEAVSANIASGERLTAPDLTFPVPKYTIIGAKGHGTLPVKYLFSGVQFRQAMKGTYDDVEASYSTVQSGKLGAQGGALSMYYEKEESTPEKLLRDDSSLTSFVEKALGFAATITKAAGQTQAVTKTLRPRSDQSERKQRRMGEQTATENDTPIRSVKSEGKMERYGERATMVNGAPTWKVRDGDGRGMPTHSQHDRSAGRFQRDKFAGTAEITSDVMNLLDDAVDHSPVQSQVLQDNGADGMDIHDTLLTQDSVQADEKRAKPWSEQTSSEDPTGSSSSGTKSE